MLYTGSWPLSDIWCIFYQTCDVLACSVSILHLMFISIARYRGIRKPFRHRSENERSVLYKIILTWLLGLLLASPIPLLALQDMHNVMPAEGVCQINNEYFVIIGSLLSFYLPMIIIVAMYVLTVYQLTNPKVGNLTGQRHVGISHLAINTLAACPGTPTVDPSSHSFMTTIPIDATHYTYK